MGCCNRKLVITEQEKLEIMSMYGILLEGELPGGGYEIDFSNTFKSGYHSAKYINKTLLLEELTAAKTWLSSQLKGDKGKLVFVKILASESRVPNADAENGGVVLAEYELSNKRAVAVNNFLSNIFDGWIKEGLIGGKPIFAFPEPTIGGPNWCPSYTKDETCVEKTDKNTDSKFTEHQYVRVQFLIDAPGMSEKCVDGLSITVSYNKDKNPSFPCRGGHQCDEADFTVVLNKVPIGSVSLNNAKDGGSRTGTVTVNPQQAKKIAATNAKKVEVYLQCKYAACHSATPEISISKNKFILPGFPRCVPSISERDDFTMKHILTLDICGNVTQQNNNQKAILPDEQFIKKPTDLKDGYLYYNEDTKQFEFSESSLDLFDIVYVDKKTGLAQERNADIGSQNMPTYTIRWQLYGSDDYGDDKDSPAKIYQQGCSSSDKANYGNYCIWSGPKFVYKTVNRAIYPPYNNLIKVEKWNFGANTGEVLTIYDQIERYGPNGFMYNYSGPGISSKLYDAAGNRIEDSDS
jgi:hypothetical protein